MKHIYTQLIYQTVIIIAFFLFLIFLFNSLASPQEIMDDPRSGAKLKEKVSTLTIQAPLFIITVFIVIGATILLALYGKTTLYKKSLEEVRDNHNLTIIQDSIFSYPQAQINDIEGTVIIEVVQEHRKTTTQIHVSVDKFIEPLTITKKGFRLATGPRVELGTTLEQTHSVTGSKETAKKGLTQEIQDNIKQTTGKWFITPTEIRYEEEGLMKTKHIDIVLTTAKLLKKKLS